MQSTKQEADRLVSVRDPCHMVTLLVFHWYVPWLSPWGGGESLGTRLFQWLLLNDKEVFCRQLETRKPFADFHFILAEVFSQNVYKTVAKSFDFKLHVIAKQKTSFLLIVLYS